MRTHIQQYEDTHTVLGGHIQQYAHSYEALLCVLLLLGGHIVVGYILLGHIQQQYYICIYSSTTIYSSRLNTPICVLYVEDIYSSVYSTWTYIVVLLYMSSYIWRIYIVVLLYMSTYYIHYYYIGGHIQQYYYIYPHTIYTTIYVRNTTHTIYIPNPLWRTHKGCGIHIKDI